MAKTMVSIALATYQGARFLPEQLASFLAQGRLPEELCVSDDGSSDGTAALIEEFARKAPFPVHFFRNPSPGGANRNFEYAIQQCRGEIILFSDQDDVWLPHHVEKLLAPFEADQRIVAVASNSEYCDQNLQPGGLTTEDVERFPARMREATMRLPANQLELVLRHRISAGHGMAFRRSLIPLIVPFSSAWTYDQWVFILAAAAGFVSYVPEALTLHRQHDSQAIGSRKLDLQTWASQSRDTTNERTEEEKWREIADRVRGNRNLVRDPDAAVKILDRKADFVGNRARTRNSSVGRRLVFSFRELLLGRYHRFGRGFLTFARDLYGSR
jgi:glycosyltransferase involved in cell wall biosynthesis